MALVHFALAAAHVIVAAIWLGAMCYSIAVVQPRAARLLGFGRYEEFAATLANGARWIVIGMCAALALTGARLVALAAADRPSSGWVAVMIAKIVLLVVALGAFANVSWRPWPKRVFALPEELPRIHRAFTWTAYTLIAVVGTEIFLGVAARTLVSG
jgi:hypothetical protein